VNRIYLIEVVLQMFINILSTLSFWFGFVPEALDLTHMYGGNHVNINATPQVLPQSGSTSKHMTTGSVVRVSKPSKKVILSDEKREQINAKRRAAYRKKKEDGTVKRQDEKRMVRKPLQLMAACRRACRLTLSVPMVRNGYVTISHA